MGFVQDLGHRIFNFVLGKQKIWMMQYTGNKIKRVLLCLVDAGNAKLFKSSWLSSCGKNREMLSRNINLQNGLIKTQHTEG